MQRAWFLAPLAFVGLVACSDDNPTTESAVVSGNVAVKLVEAAQLDQPLAFAVHPSAPSPVFIGEKTGRVRALDVTDERVTTRPAPVLDISDRVSGGSEQGLLGIAFDPAGTNLYVNYTNRDGDTRVAEYPFVGGRADKTRERVLLAVDQPFPNHNGGHLVFGPDGMLYIGLGDGGSGGDPQDNGQKLTTLLGKILRIDPTPAGYSAPADNPFMQRGLASARPEIWHYGLRNPWRFSFDRGTGDMWIADVGQNDWEEVDRAPKGEGGLNFGWNRREGAHRFLGGPLDDAVDPVIELSHADGNCSITGGYVYRGRAIPALEGKYVFGDFCKGELSAASTSGDPVVSLGPTVESLSGFGEDTDGELWVLSLSGPVYRLVAA